MANSWHKYADPEDATLGIGGTFDNATLKARQDSGYYNEMDTPEELVARVRWKMASVSKEAAEKGQAIIDFLATDSIDDLTAGMAEWAPTLEEYRANRKEEWQKKFDAFSEAANHILPDSVKEELDNDFHAVLDQGGKNETKTERPGLFKYMLAFMGKFVPKDKVEVKVEETVEREEVLVGRV